MTPMGPEIDSIFRGYDPPGATPMVYKKPSDRGFPILSTSAGSSCTPPNLIDVSIVPTSLNPLAVPTGTNILLLSTGTGTLKNKTLNASGNFSWTKDGVPLAAATVNSQSSLFIEYVSIAASSGLYELTFTGECGTDVASIQITYV